MRWSNPTLSTVWGMGSGRGTLRPSRGLPGVRARWLEFSGRGVGAVTGDGMRRQRGSQHPASLGFPRDPSRTWSCYVTGATCLHGLTEPTQLQASVPSLLPSVLQGTHGSCCYQQSAAAWSRAGPFGVPWPAVIHSGFREAAAAAIGCSITGGGPVVPVRILGHLSAPGGVGA